MENNLTQLLTTNPEYRKTYVKYKIQVEHRNIPKKLLEALPTDIRTEIQRLYYETLKTLEKKKILFRKGDSKTNQIP